MGIPVLIMGESGSGKPASLRNFTETEVGIFNVAGKPLPFRKKLNKIDNAKYQDIVGRLKAGKLKTYVIDDSQYLMAFELFDKAKEVKYINNTANISEANFMYAKDYVDNIKSYRLYGLYDYYNTEVIGDIVDKFLSDEIDENKFLKELKSRTEIYLDDERRNQALNRKV